MITIFQIQNVGGKWGKEMSLQQCEEEEGEGCGDEGGGGSLEVETISSEYAPLGAGLRTTRQFS